MIPNDYQFLSDDELQYAIKRIESIRKKRKERDFEMLGLMDIDQYEPYPTQEKFHASDKRIRIFLGGNYTGKTLAGAAESVWWLLKCHKYHEWVNDKNYPVHGLGIVVDHKQQKLPGGPQDKLLSFLPESQIHKIVYNKQNAVDVIYLKNGSSFTFKSATARRDTIQGTRVDFVWIDEDSIPSGNYFDELQTRLPSSGARLFMWFTMTPNLKEGGSWVTETIFPRANKTEHPDIGMWEATINDNPYISDDAKHDLFNNLVGDETQQQARLLGNWRIKSGLVYNFNIKVHVIPQMPLEQIREHSRAVFEIIDPHPSKPIAVVFAAVLNDGRIVVYDELYQQGLVSQVAAWIKAKRDPVRHLLEGTIIDYSGNQKNKIEGRSIVEEFRNCGIHCTNCRKDVSGGIEIVKRLLFYDVEQHIAPKLFVTANCSNVIREFGSYRWDNKTGKPVKAFDETMDAIRYLVCDPKFKIYLEGKVSPEEFRKSTLTENEMRISINNARYKRRMQMMGPGVGRKQRK